MSSERVRLVERSYMSMLLRTDPSFYENANPLNRTAYEFSNGRRFTGQRPYGTYFPREFNVTYLGQPVTYGSGFVTQEVTEAEYLAGIFDV